MSTTINKAFVTLKSYFQWLVESHVLTDHPLKNIKQVQQSKRPPKWLDRKEQLRLLREVQKDGNPRNLAMIQLMLHAGIRVDECCNLQLNDIELSDRKGKVIIRQGKGAKWREIPLNYDVRMALQAYLEVRSSPSPWLFVSERSPKMTTRAAQFVLQKYAKRAEIEHVTPHTLRHTFCHELARKGISLDVIATLAGHMTSDGRPNISTTVIYTTPGEHDLQKAVEPTFFVTNRWQNHVHDEDGNINRHYYEMAALTELRNLIRSGDISVVGSRKHKDFDEYLVSKQEWGVQSPNTRLAVSLSAVEYLKERTETLRIRLQWVCDHLDELEGVIMDSEKIRVDRLEKNVPEEAQLLSSSLYGMVPRVKLTDLLLEVAHWTGFDQLFVHASTGRPPKGEEKAVVMATLMAMGTNIGLTKMAEATPGISYHQMANMAQWRMYDDAMNRAQANLVNFQSRLALSSYWGDGSTSSSDGMRVQVGVSSLHADANPHYGTGKGATIYCFVSDQFSSFYTKIINTNARDAVHVIDGLLYHESELCIQEHYTDTAGYTDQVFGLSHLLGFHFAPRLRDLADSKLYTVDKPSDFPKIEPLLRGRINMKLIQENYDDVLRLRHSIREGKVSGSLIMGKLGSYARQNRLATALREMGRIEKTIFILDYISDEALRRRIQRGLNKGEAMNALARAIFFGKRGELRERSMQDQLQRASALNILINAISVWNTVYLAEATKHLKEKGELQEDLLRHVSPLGWEHINFLGEYTFDLKNVRGLDSLRSLIF